jgi:chitinase
MGNNPPRQKLSLIRLFIVLVPIVLLIVLGAQFTDAMVSSARSGMPGIWFAPYVDVTLTPMLHFEDELEQISDDVVLGFIVANPEEPCLPSWGTYYNLEAAARALDLDRRIVRLRERGGDVMISFGGAINNELAVVCTDEEELAAAYQMVIDRYELQAIDFDIEGAALGDRESNSRRAAAVRQLQDANDNLDIWLTLPVAPHGLSDDALALIDDFLQAGIDLEGVNLMTMNYGGSRTSGMSMQEATFAALAVTKGQLADAYSRAEKPRTDGELWQMLGATPMIGQNDVSQDVFSTEDAEALVDFSRKNGLGRLSFWSVNRDMSCGMSVDRERVSNTCSGVEQDAQEFTRIFAEGINLHPLFSSEIIARATTSASSEISAPIVPFTRDDPRTSPYPLWREERAYEQGAKVVWQGRVYQAKWWSEGEQPDVPVENVWDTPWRYLGPVLESDREAVREIPVLSGNWARWSGEKVFLQGDEIMYENQVFRAKWWTQGEVPQEYPDQPYDHPWEYLGDVDCEGGSCLGEQGSATLAIDYEGLAGVSFEIREDDYVDGTVGRLVRAHDGQSGQKTYEVLHGMYDLVFKMAAAEVIIDSVACFADGCDPVDIATTLSVDFEGLTNVGLEIRIDDGVEGSAGDLVQSHGDQSGNRSYVVLRGDYDLAFDAGGIELIVDSVACSLDNCNVRAISSVLSVDYQGLTDVNLEMRHNDRLAGTVGGLVLVHEYQRGRISYRVLRGSYDLMFVQKHAEFIIDAVDCSEDLCDGGSVINVVFDEEE